MVKISIDSRLRFRLTLLFTVVSLIAVGLGMYFLSKIANTVRRSKIKVAEINRDIALLDKIMEDRKTYSGDIRKVKFSFPATYYEVSFFTTQLERLAQGVGVTIQISIDQNRVEEKEQYDSITYSVKISGSYTAISDFLSQLAKLPYHTQVDQMKISSEGGGTVANVKFKLFIQE